VSTSTIPPFFTGRMPFLPPNQQCQSTEGKATTRNKHKKLKPGLVASYNIQPGNGEGLFWFQCFINLSLTYLRHLPTYLQPWVPHRAHNDLPASETWLNGCPLEPEGWLVHCTHCTLFFLLTPKCGALFVTSFLFHLLLFTDALLWV